MAPSEIDYYLILGVTRHAKDEDIKKAFRKLARDTHPDKNPNDPSAKEKFQNLQQAYDTLKDDMSRSKYDQDNPYHGYGGSRPSAYASWEQPAYSSTPRNSSTTTRNTGASTAKRYTAGTTAQATPSWSSHPREGFAQQAASGNGRTYTRGPAYDAHDDYTSTRKTRAGYSYETYTADFTTKTPKKPAEPYFSTTYPAPEPKESAYARTSQRQYSATPKATATTSGNSSSSSPRPKSTAGTQQQPPRPTTPNLNGGGFDLKAYIREKQAKEVREAEVKKAEDDAARRERHDKHDRERRRKAEELKKRHNEEQLHQEARSAEREATFGGSDGYGSGDRHRGNRKWSSYETPVDSEDDDDLEKLAEEALKAKTSRPKHTSGTARRRRSPLKTKADREARARKATAASPVPPTSEAWFGPEVQKSEFDFRPPAYKTDADGIRVYNVDPDSDSSVENQSDYYSDKNRTTDGSGTKSYPAPPIFGDATKAQAKRDNIPQPASHASKLTPPTSPQATTKKGSPDQQKPTATKQESPRSFLGFVFGDGKNPYNPWKFQQMPTPDENVQSPFSFEKKRYFGSFSQQHSPEQSEEEAPPFNIQRPKSQPTHATSTRVPPPSASAAPETQNMRKDQQFKKELFEELLHTVQPFEYQPGSNTSSAPRRKSSVPKFNKAKPGSKASDRASNPDTKHQPHSQPTVESDTDSTSSISSIASAEFEEKTTPQSSDGIEPMDTEPDRGIPEPMAPPPPPPQPRTHVRSSLNPRQTSARATPGRRGTPRPSSQTTGLASSLDDLGKSFNVPPLARSPADVGLGDLGELKDTLPFPSQASDKPPVAPSTERTRPPKDRFTFSLEGTDAAFWDMYPQTPAEEERLIIPKPPRIPRIPRDVSLPSYNRFYNSLGPYIVEWNQYEEEIHKRRSELLKKGMQIPKGQEDAPLNLDAVGIMNYISRVKDKDMVLDGVFKKARDRHMEALESWVKLRDEVMKLGKH